MAQEEHASLNRSACAGLECCNGGRGGNDAGRGGAGRGRRGGGSDALWRLASAEAAGTALLVALTCLAGCAPPAPALHRALAGGLVVTLLVQCFDHVSGAYLNPTVTLAAVARGRLGPGAGAALGAAQLAGAAAGAGLLRLLAPGSSDAAALACLTLPADHVSVYKAVLIEAVLGGCLALANCASWDPRNRLLVGSWPARIGLIVTALSLVAGELTGASMNPARSFGPALWAANFDRHWVYWVGPLSGSLLCSVAYAGAWGAAPGDAARAHPAPCTPAPCAAAPAPAPAPDRADHHKERSV